MPKSVRKTVLVIDQGTTGTQVSLIDSRSGKLISYVDKEHRQFYPKPGWVEHDAEEIWQNCRSLIDQLLKKLKTEVVALGITNQRETLVAWDAKTSKPLTRAIVWQCRRSAEICDELRPHEPELKKITGLVLDPYFSATKMMWMLRHVPAVKKAADRGQLRMGTIDTFLIWKLTQGEHFVSDVTNASRTLLMDLQNLEWSERALQIFGLEKRFLARITPSASKQSIGVVRSIKNLAGVSISGVAGDQQAALFGQTCFLPGEAKVTFGTGSFILVNSGPIPVLSSSGLISTVGWQLEGQAPLYALEGGAFICGALVQWFRDELKWIKKSSHIEGLAKKAQLRLGKLEPEQSLFVVPAFSGLGAPFWKPQARGAIFGLTRGSGISEIAYASLEGLAIQNQWILKSMEQDLGKPLLNIKVDGGAALNSLLMQLQANFSGVEVMRPKNIESTTMGAAYLAGLGVGLWDQSGLLKIWQKDRTFKPNKMLASRCQRKAQIWRQLAEKSELF
jgi:glycerol kinase